MFKRHLNLATSKLKRRSHSSVGRAAFEALEPRQLLSVSLVKDINAPRSTYSGFWGYMAAGNVAYIQQEDTTHGRELWRSDGTAAGTYLLKDVNPGGASSFPGNMTAVGGSVFFSADDGTHGVELWKTDGTPDGTVLVKDINPGIGASNPSNFVNVNGTLFFLATDGVHGTELWTSDGTAGGTTMVKDIDPGSANGITIASNLYPPLIAENGLLLFPANDGVNGTELWRSDGTAAGTFLLADISSGSGSSSPHSFYVSNGYAYFAASTSSDNGNVWKTDGTATGTVKYSQSNYALNVLAAIGNDVYYTYNAGAGGTYRTDGTVAGTYKTATNFAFPTLANGSLYYFSAGTVYRTDGATVTTVRAGFTNVQGIFNINGTVYLSADDGSGIGDELWTTGGTPATTTLFKDVSAGSFASAPYSLLALGTGSTFLFIATDPTLGGALYVSDGTAAGTGLLDEIFTGTQDGTPAFFTPFNGYDYFNATDGVTGTTGGELYRTDGTAAGTTLVDDVYPGATGSVPKNLTVFNGKLYFNANDGIHGAELWQSDGTAAGTSLVADIDPGSAGSNPSSDTTASFVVSGAYLYFTANDGTTGTELWRTDGTAAGTIRVVDAYSGSSSGAPSSLTDVNGTLFFIASNASGRGLWKTDGTPAGTVELRSDLSSLASFANVNGTLYFTAYTSGLGYQLYKSDGTAAGTTLVLGAAAAYSASAPTNLVNVNGTLFFSNTSSTTGTELWKSDGTAAGTVLVDDIYPGVSSSSPASLTSVNGVLYFTANDGVHGVELWRSDGTAVGTYLLKDIVPGSANGALKSLVAVNGYLYFSAAEGSATPQTGSFPWRSDGTTAGTVMLDDTSPGTLQASTSAGGFVPVGNAVLFSYRMPAVGIEPFIVAAPSFSSLAADGTLTLTGTANNDALHLTSDGSTITATMDGLTSSYNASAVSSLAFNGNGGQETIQIDSTLPAPLQFASSTSIYTLNVNAGTLSLTADAASTGGVSVHVAAGATVSFAGNQHLTSLNLAGGSASIAASSGSPYSLTINGPLAIAAGGSLDLGKGQLILDATTSAAAIRADLLAGYDGGKWDGTGGIVSSYAALTPGVSIGYAAAGEPGASALPTGYCLIKPALIGDANLDGKANGLDTRQIYTGGAFNDGQSAHDWSAGDMNYDGLVNGLDTRLIYTSGNFNNAAQTLAMIDPTLTAVAPAQTVAQSPSGVAVPVPQGVVVPAVAPAVVVEAKVAVPAVRPRLSPFRRIAAQRRRAALFSNVRVRP